MHPCVSFRCGYAARESWKGPERFTASRASKRARVSSVAATSSNWAALQTSASSRPCRCTACAPPEPPPIASAPLPLTELSAADLGAFFELSFPDKRLIELCHELKLHTPGYRLEALPPDQVARVLADEYLAAKDVRPHLDAALKEALRDPVLE